MNSFKHLKTSLIFTKKLQGFVEKEEYCAKIKLGFQEIAIFVYTQLFYHETISDWFRGAILTGFFFFFFFFDSRFSLRHF